MYTTLASTGFRALCSVERNEKADELGKESEIFEEKKMMDGIYVSL